MPIGSFKHELELFYAFSPHAQADFILYGSPPPPYGCGFDAAPVRQDTVRQDSVKCIGNGEVT